ncbi:MAG: bifunctional 5,10-methylene-tetrahydrofolate dehydrogenase/5,10-methylene-tetrahydrofolate cyclohydrolase, partial [Flavobacteriales bacterium CG18_big_fil_WC_8_21_14_2_50_32_9]
MNPTIVSGIEVSNKIKEEIAAQVKLNSAKGMKTPHLAAVLVGNDGASKTYVNAKVKACEAVGFKSTLVKLDENTTEEKLLEEIRKLNNDTDLDGFIVQLPL